MSTILDEIIAYKKTWVKSCKDNISYGEVEKKALATPTPVSFAEPLRNPTHESIKIIAEVKKASPSKGVISKDFDPLKTAIGYEKIGAHCVSVLTDVKYFQGEDRFLDEISNTISLPCLRKDFIVDEYQILEARALGASAILLIVDCLSNEEIIRYQKFAKSLGLDSLVETHRKEEVERALECDAQLIGVNNRNLRTFATDLETSFQLREMVPNDRIFLSESGISTPEHIKQLLACKTDAVLVGESLMRSNGQLLQQLLA